MPERLTREQRRARTREQLLNAAEALIAERGVNGASLERIAERAGFSRGAVYGNFTGKHDLVLALLERRTRRELDDIAALREGADSFGEVLDRLRDFHRRRAAQLDQWFALRAELLLYATRHPQVRPRLAEREHLARRALADGITAALAAHGLAPPAEPALLALIVHALDDGLSAQRVTAADGVADDTVVDAFELLLRSWTALAREETP